MQTSRLQEGNSELRDDSALPLPAGFGMIGKVGIRFPALEIPCFLGLEERAVPLIVEVNCTELLRMRREPGKNQPGKSG
jgi:hypothetical protein